MHPTHNPEIKDALPPASLELLDGRARDVANRQLDRLERSIGREADAHLPEHDDIPLHGYRVQIGTEQVDLALDTNAQGEAQGEDRVFVDARNSLAVLRSREHSRGSRFWNFAFRKARGDGYGHGWETQRAEDVYHEQLGNFIARKVAAHIAANPAHNNEDAATEIVANAVIQDQQQMSALERMAAERKSGGSGLFNSLRKNKALRIAVSVGLGVGAALAGASGLWTVAVPLMGARAALSASGGYMLGRTGWDGFQGHRTRSLPNDDIRMASDRTHDISGRLLEPEGAFHRFVNILGAEARVGSSKQRRQQLIHRLNNLDLVRQYYTADPAAGPANPNRLDFSGGWAAADISHRLGLLFTNMIRPREDERLASDQTQSRKRHIAGLVGATVFAGLTLSSAIEILNVALSGHEHLSSAASAGHKAAMTKGGGKTPAPLKGSGSSSPNASSSPSSLNGQAAGGSLKVPSGDTVVIVPAHSTISINEVSQVNSNPGNLAANGASTSVLHVQPGGGFISTFESQYGLTPQQADATYGAMYGQLHGSAGTYLCGTDIRISAPGNFSLTGGEQSILTQQLSEYGKLPLTSSAVTESTSNSISNLTITTGTAHSVSGASHPVIEVNGGNVILSDVNAHTRQALVGGHSASSALGPVTRGSLNPHVELGSRTSALGSNTEANSRVGVLHQWLMHEHIRHMMAVDDDELVAA